MITEELIKNYFLTKGKTIKAYLLGNEDKLFLTEDHDHIKNVFKSNKKKTRMFFYRVNYFLALLIFLSLLIFSFSLVLIKSKIDNSQNPIGFSIVLIPLLLIFLLYLKPLVHLFSLKNKRNKMNIHLYKNLYGENNFKNLSETPEIQEKKDRSISKGLIVGIILVLVILFMSAPFIGMIGQEEGIKEQREEVIKTNTNSITEEEEVIDLNLQTNSKTFGLYPQTSTKLLTLSDIRSASLADLKIMRNEIFARHGHAFKQGGEIDNYFRNQDWYKSKNLDATSLLTEIEKDNISLIKSRENEFVEYKGKIKSDPITMKIKFYGEYNCINDGSLIEGYYYYNKSGESNKLILKGHSCGTKITIEEKDSNNKTTGVFIGVQSNDKIEGVWKNSKTDEKLDFIIRKDKIATITGTDIIMRNGHSTKSEIVGSFKKAGEKVIILDTSTSEKQTVLIKNKIIVNDNDGEVNTLQKGKSVKIIAINEEPPIEILISFKNKKGKIKEVLVSENDIDYINESWYKVKRDNGEIGWVFGKFIKMM
ncbi:YARHG domain-containing protein [Lacinutrix sp. MEBiC02404]